MYYKSFDEEVAEIKTFGEFLIPYNFPQVPPEEEEPINYIKPREIRVDGYNLIVHYSKADYGTHYLETLQVLGKYSPFLPFSLVCKIGKKFMGDQYLSLVELYKDNRKIYCWTLILNKNNKPIPGPYQQDDTEHCTYEGLEYRCVSPKQVNLH